MSVIDLDLTENPSGIISYQASCMEKQQLYSISVRFEPHKYAILHCRRVGEQNTPNSQNPLKSGRIMPMDILACKLKG
jgi:hypothetical protein